MRLADYIKQRRSTISTAPDNTKEMAAKFEDLSKPEQPPLNKKVLNQDIVKQQEQANYGSPYTGESPTTTSPSPVQPNPLLRDHIKSYKQHAMKQDKNKYGNKEFT